MQFYTFFFCTKLEKVFSTQCDVSLLTAHQNVQLVGKRLQLDTDQA